MSLAQSSSQKLLTGSGGDYSSQGLNMEFSLGEIMIESYEDGSNIMTQGLHQGFLRLTAINEHAVNSEIIIFPNPTKDWLKIDFKKEINGQLQLSDINGKLIVKRDFRDVQSDQINIQELAQGTYFLSLFIDNQRYTYQIQKMK